jgi:hypothetical protein
MGLSLAFSYLMLAVEYAFFYSKMPGKKSSQRPQAPETLEELLPAAWLEFSGTACK